MDPHWISSLQGTHYSTTPQHEHHLNNSNLNPSLCLLSTFTNGARRWCNIPTVMAVKFVAACRKRQRVRGGHWHSQRIHSSKLRLSQRTQNWVCTQLDGPVDQHANQWEEWSAWCRQRGERPRMASSLSHTRRCVAAIGFGAAPHYNLITIHLLWQDCVKAPPRLVPPRRREIKLADAQLKHFTFLQGRHSSPFTSEPERACINVEVFINGVKINASLKSIATWEPVHRLPIDWPTLISLIHLIAPDVFFFFSLRNWRLVVFSWVLRLEFYYSSSRFLCCFHIMLPPEGTQPWTSSVRTSLSVISTAPNIWWTSSFSGWNGSESHPQ